MILLTTGESDGRSGILIHIYERRNLEKGCIIFAGPGSIYQVDVEIIEELEP